MHLITPCFNALIGGTYKQSFFRGWAVEAKCKLYKKKHFLNASFYYTILIIWGFNTSWWRYMGRLCDRLAAFLSSRPLLRRSYISLLIFCIFVFRDTYLRIPISYDDQERFISFDLGLERTLAVEQKRVKVRCFPLFRRKGKYLKECVAWRSWDGREMFFPEVNIARIKTIQQALKDISFSLWLQYVFSLHFLQKKWKPRVMKIDIYTNCASLSSEM